MRNRNRDGSAMVLAIIAFIILAGIGAAFFSIALARERTTTKAASSDSALAIAEAGLDDAINRMNAYANYSGSTIPTSADFFTISTSTTLADGSVVTQVTGTVNGGNYTVHISPAYTTKGTYKLTSSATKGSEARAIEAYVSPSPNGPSFDYGLFGDVVVDAGGNITSDSYLSSKGYQGQLQPDGYFYDRTNGSVGSNGDVEVGGKSQIFGNATPGPGGTFNDGGGAYVMGTTTPATSSTDLYTIEYNADSKGYTGYSTLPKKFSDEPTGEYVMNSATNTSNSDGAYRFADFDTQPGETIRVTGPTVIYVDNLINLQGDFVIDTDKYPTASVTIYHGQPSSTGVASSENVSINAQSFTGTTPLPTPNLFQLYSATTGTIKLNGGAGIYAAVYAPQSTYTNEGGSTLYGAVVAKTVKIVGGATFHYDEEINNSLTKTFVYRIKSWKEYIP